MAEGGQAMVSVVVPAWNAEQTIGETLQSISAQTHRNLEILIVDDGSTDATAAIAQEYCASEPRARLISQENGGVAAARNRAIKEARGEWIAPIDADDLWHPTKIEKQVAAALSTAERPALVYCWHRLIDERDRVIGSGPRWAVNGRAFNQLAYLNVVENGSALLLWRYAVLEVGGYDPGLRDQGAQGCEDVLIQLEIGRRHGIACVPEHLVGHRRHGQNMSSGFERMLRSWRLVYSRISAEEPRLPRSLIRWVEGKCAFDIAQQRAVEGRYGDALRHLSEALLLDPRRCGALVAYRIGRSAARRLRRPRSAEKPRFQDVDPAARISGDPHELPMVSRLVDWVNARRMRRFAAVDQAASSVARGIG